MARNKYDADVMTVDGLYGWCANHNIPVEPPPPVTSNANIRLQYEADLRARVKSELGVRASAKLVPHAQPAHVMAVRSLPVKIGGPNSEVVFIDVRVLERKEGRKVMLLVEPLAGRGEVWIAEDRLVDAEVETPLEAAV